MLKASFFHFLFCTSVRIILRLSCFLLSEKSSYLHLIFFHAVYDSYLFILFQAVHFIVVFSLIHFCILSLRLLEGNISLYFIFFRWFCKTLIRFVCVCVCVVVVVVVDIPSEHVYSVPILNNYLTADRLKRYSCLFVCLFVSPRYQVLEQLTSFVRKVL